MSKKVDFDEVTRRGYRGRLVRWERWCDGEAHLLVQGEDFQGTRVDSTRSAGIQWAARHGLKARTSIVDGRSFVFQIVEGLSDEQIEFARALQAAEAEGGDDAVRAAFDERRHPAWEPQGDPVAERRAKLSDEDAAQELIRAKRPSRTTRAPMRSRTAPQSG
jgi:hypothetical protein